MLYSEHESQPERLLPSQFLAVPSPAPSPVLRSSAPSHTVPTLAMTPEAKEALYLHDHFAFNAVDDVEKLVNLLPTQYEFKQQFRAFLDEYYDTPDRKLSKKAAWLRRRDRQRALIQSLEKMD